MAAPSAGNRLSARACLRLLAAVSPAGPPPELVLRGSHPLPGSGSLVKPHRQPLGRCAVSRSWICSPADQAHIAADLVGTARPLCRHLAAPEWTICRHKLSGPEGRDRAWAAAEPAFARYVDSARHAFGRVAAKRCSALGLCAGRPQMLGHPGAARHLTSRADSRAGRGWQWSLEPWA